MKRETRPSIGQLNRDIEGIDIMLGLLSDIKNVPEYDKLNIDSALTSVKHELEDKLSALEERALHMLTVA